MRWSFIPALVFAIAPQASWSSAETEANELPKSVESVLAAPDEFELWSLEPHTAGEPSYLGNKVLGRTRVSDPAQQSALVNSLRRGISEPGDAVACFDPRHMIRARRGADQTDLLICFACGSLIIFLNGEKIEQLQTTFSPQAVFDAALLRARVPLAAIHPETPDEPTP